MKIKLIITSITLMATLAGCATDKDKVTTSTPEPTAQEQSQLGEVEPDAPTETPTSKNKPSRGTWADNMYTNEFTNISFKAPEGWIIATEEEMAETMGLGVDVIQKSDVAFNEQMLDLVSINDTMLQDPTTGSNIIIMYENMALGPVKSRMTEKDYFDSLKKQMSSLEGMNYEFGEELTKQTISGEEYTLLKASESTYGANQYYYVKLVDNYMVCIIVSIFGDAEIDNIMANFN